jgi:PPOX class probable F420-dependent enzyme
VDRMATSMAMTSNEGRGLTHSELVKFLTEGAIMAKIASMMPDGHPVVSPVWYEWQEESNSFLIVSKEKTSLIRNLRRDPRCGLLVDNTTTPYKRVSVQGKAEFLDSGFDWITPATRMARRYLGEPGVAYAQATFGFPRVPFWVRPQRMSTWNGGGFDRTFSRATIWHDDEGEPGTA